jgi:glycine/D-amino acid oxidase-like deaminating enzyme
MPASAAVPPSAPRAAPLAGSRPDAVIVGGGIVGAACAYELSRAGLRVLVLEAGFVGGGTTAAGMGHVVVMDDSEAQFALTSYSARLWAELAPELGAACELDPCGTLWVAEDEAQLLTVREKHAFYAARGVEAEILDGDEVARLEPQLRPGLAGGLRVPGDSVVYPPMVARWLLDRAREQGAVLREGAMVTAIEAGAVIVGGGACSGGCEAVGERIETGLVINAAGAAAATLTPGLPLLPRKGHLAITDRYPGFCRHQLVELGYLQSAHTMTTESVAFNVQPRRTGQLLIGSSRELVGWDASLNRQLLGRMLARAAAFMPELASLSTIRSWVGFRPATPDKLPLIGAWEGVAGLWIAAGHEGLGITTSLGTGRLLVDLVLGRPPAFDPAPFAPGRALAAAEG